MEYRRIKPPKEVEWDNPILTASKQPHLGDIIFPTDTQGKNAQKPTKFSTNSIVILEKTTIKILRICIILSGIHKLIFL